MEKQVDGKYKENINNRNIPSMNKQNIPTKINGRSFILQTHN